MQHKAFIHILSFLKKIIHKWNKSNKMEKKNYNKQYEAKSVTSS